MNSVEVSKLSNFELSKKHNECMPTSSTSSRTEIIYSRKVIFEGLISKYKDQHAIVCQTIPSL